MATVKISELPAGQVVGDTTADATFVVKSGVADGGSAVGVKLDTTNALATDFAKPVQFATGGGELGAFQKYAGSHWLAVNYVSILAGPIGGGSVQSSAVVIDGANLQITIGSNGLFRWTATAGGGGGFGTPDLAWGRAAANIANLTNASTGGAAIQFTEMTAPSAGASNTARLFCRDNGSGKSQLCVIFATGAIQVVATEP